jgi:hypothetical protein
VAILAAAAAGSSLRAAKRVQQTLRKAGFGPPFLLARFVRLLGLQQSAGWNGIFS